MTRFEVCLIIGYRWRNYDKCFNRGIRKQRTWCSFPSILSLCLPTHSPHRLLDWFCASISMSSAHILLTAGKWLLLPLGDLNLKHGLDAFIFTPAYRLYIHPLNLLSKFNSIHVNEPSLSTCCVQGNVDIEVKSHGLHSQNSYSSGETIKTASSDCTMMAATAICPWYRGNIMAD